MCILPMIRSGSSLVFRAKSHRWPHNTRSVARNLLIVGILVAFVQLGISAALTHNLWSVKNTVTCLENETPGEPDFDVGLNSNLSEYLIYTEGKELPLTFMNFDLLVYWKEKEFLDKEPPLGPRWLSVEKMGGSATIMGNLMALPTVLPFCILICLGNLIRRKSMSNRTGMLFAIFLAAFFLFNVMCATFNNVYTHEEHEEYSKCWQRDTEMVALERWARHANTFLIGFGAMGLIGACLMLTVFVFALIAAHVNCRRETGQSVRLDNLRGDSGDRHNDTSVPFPSAGLGNGATSTPDTGSGLSLPGAAAKLDGRQRPAKKMARDEEEAESREELRDPFADPEDPFRDPVGRGKAATQDPETARWR